MAKLGVVEHLGEIVEIKDNSVKVLVRSASACSGCHARGACTSADFQDKYIDSKVPDGKAYSLGEKVKVICDDKQGFYALFWAYIFPLLLVMTMLFVGFAILHDELKAGLLSLAILPFYYLFLYVRRRFFDSKLQMNIKKITL